jgi:hypothetical protein
MGHVSLGESHRLYAARMPFIGESEEARSRRLAELHGLIAEHGWAVRNVMAGPEEGDDVEFSYTIGLTALGHPEVIILGMPSEHASTFLNMIGDEVQRGGRFDHGTVTGEFTSDDSPVVFIRAEDTERLTAVAEVYGRVDALQMVWPDSTGRLPWQNGYRNPPETQPLLLRTPPDE